MVENDTSQVSAEEWFLNLPEKFSPDQYHREVDETLDYNMEPGDIPSGPHCTKCVIGENRYLRIISTDNQEVEAEVIFYTCTAHGSFFRVRDPIPQD